MTTSDVILLAGVMPALLVASGIISGSETALFGLTQADRDVLKHQNPGARAAVDALLKKPRALLTAILLSNMLVNVTYFTLSSIVILSFEERANHAGSVGVAVGALVAIVLFGEVIAKTTASAHRARACAVIASIWLLLIQVLWPLWSGIDRFVMAPLTRLVTARPSDPRTIDPSELQYILGPQGEDEHIDADEQRLLLDVFRLGTLRVREVMTPRVQLDTLPETAKREDVIRFIREHRPERVLVIDNDEAPVGFVNPSSYLRSITLKPKARLADSVERPLFIPEQTRLDSALEQLRTKGRDRAAVVDERGELVGVLRVEDVVAELIDDASHTISAGEVQMQGLGEFLVPGRMSAGMLLHDLDPGALQFGGPLSKVTTIAGVVLTLLGRLPKKGDSVMLGNLEIVVASLDGRAIESVLIRITGADEEVSQ